MAIITESQVYVDCDCCGEYYATQTMTQKEVMCFLRNEGWTFGKIVKCPKCRGKKEVYS